MAEHEQDLGLTPSSEAEYREQVKSTLTDVFSLFLNKGGPVKRRLPVFKDAVKRGYPLILEQLSAQGLSYETVNGLAIKKYWLEADELKWQLVPKSDDPLQKLEFFKKTQEQQVKTSGITDVWTEHWIVEQMVIEGTRQQSRLYQQFKATHQTVQNIKSNARDAHILQYLQSPSVYFDQVTGTYTQLSAEAGQNMDQLFIERFVVTNDSLLGVLTEVAQISDEVRKLSSLYPQSKRIHSLAIELLTDPDSFKSKRSLLQPVTTLEKITRVKNFLAQLDLMPPEEQLESLYIASLTSANAVEGESAEVFKGLGVGPKLAKEFIERLLIRTLKNMPGKQSGGRELLDYYNLSDPLTRSTQTRSEKTEETKEETKRGQRAVIARTTAEIKTIYLQILRERFPKTLFNRLSFPEKQKVLSNAFADLTHMPDLYNSVVSKIFQALNLDFSLSDTKEVSIKSTLRADASYQNQESQIVFLDFCKQKIAEGNTELLKAINNLLTHAVITGALKRDRKPVNKDLYYKLASFAGIYHDRTATIIRATQNAACYGLLISTEITEANFEMAVRSFTRTALQGMDSVEKIMEYKSEDIDVELFIETVKEYADLYRNSALTTFLPPTYAEDTREFIKKLIEDAIPQSN